MTADQAKTIFDFLLGTIEREHSTTKRVIGAIPEGKGDYTPDANSMSAMDLAWHIAASEQMFLVAAATGAFPSGGGKRPDSITTVAELNAWYAEQNAANLAKAKQISGEDALRVIGMGGRFEMPAVNWMQLLIGHSVHHRGQLSAYLRPMGAKVPAIYGGSFDEPMK